MSSHLQIYGISSASGNPPHLCPNSGAYAIAATQSEQISTAVGNVLCFSALLRFL